MANWNDKLIFAVRFNAAHTHIEFVRYRLCAGDSIAEAVTQLSRLEVIAKIRAGEKFSTMFKSTDRWRLGSSVEIVRVGSSEYIKTKPDSTPADNLDNLPEF